MERQPEAEWMDDPQVAAAYAAADFAEVNARFVDRLLELAESVGLPADASVLDLGTGPGDIPIRVSSRRPGWRITAVDASAAMLDLARKAVSRLPGNNSAPSIVWHQADIRATALNAQSFDLIFSNSLLHHLHEPGALWSTIRELGRPGCAVFIRDLVRPTSDEEARDIVDLYASQESETLQREFCNSLRAAFSTDEIRQQLQLSGLGHWAITPASDRHCDIVGILP